MTAAVLIVSMAVAGFAAWFIEKQIEPWRRAEKAKGNRRVDGIASAAIIGTFFVALFAAAYFFIWLH